jgi:hypothetical protein
VQQQQSQTAGKEGERAEEVRHMNGSAVRRRCLKLDQNGHCPQEHAQLQFKVSAHNPNGNMVD